MNGAALFTVNSFVFIYVLSKGKNNLTGEFSFTKDFYEYFDKIKKSIIISQFIILIVFQYFIKIFMFLFSYYF